MKIQEILDAHYEASATTSELSRNLSFAGIAVIWVLKVGEQTGGIIYTPALILPLFFFVLSLASDLFQYIYKTFIWGVLNKIYWEKYEDNDYEVEVSPWINTPTNIFFLIKIAAVVVGYVTLLHYLGKHMA